MSADVLVNCDDLSRTHGTRTLFEGVSLGVFEGDRIGLVGPNGSGKTTLLRILAGLERPDAGNVSRRKFLRVGFVPQSPELPLDVAVLEAIERELADLGLEDHEIAGRVAESLGRAGFVDSSRQVGELSGGWRKRLAIACALAREPEILLLDEPTNHLDVEGILWLEALLAADRRACVVVSHDRWFLQNVATRMVELSRTWPGGVFNSRGSYADFLEKRDEALAGQEAYQASLANTVRREIEWLRRGAKARTTKSQARIKEAGRLQDELAAVRTRTATARAAIDFTSSQRKSKRLLVAEGVGKSLGGRRILADVDMTLVSGMRLGVIGANGSGKTTLLRLLAGEIQPDEGTIRPAPGLVVVRFEQDRESLDPSLSLRRALAPEGDAVTFRGEQVHVSSWARRFLFRNDQLQVQVGRLSGGEQARILIARLMLRPADLLLMDEPTNDLDIATLEILEESLTEFPGALVLVTHDRFMLDRVATTLVAVKADGRVVSYADLAQWQATRQQAAIARPRGVSASTAAAPRETRAAGRLSYRETQELAGMEARIVAADERVAACRLAVEDPAIARNASELQQRHLALAAAEEEVARLYARWAELEA